MRRVKAWLEQWRHRRHLRHFRKDMASIGLTLDYMTDAELMDFGKEWLQNVTLVAKSVGVTLEEGGRALEEFGKAISEEGSAK